MSDLLFRRQRLLAQPAHYDLLSQCLRGIERECLRVDCEGLLALTPHPVALGSALTHPQITTDYSESLLEFITPAMPGAVWWSTHSGHGFEFFFSFGRSQSIVELMGPEPVVVAHQVLTNISLSLLPSQVARGRYPL